GHHLVLRYRGEIHHPLESAGEEYARGFKETPGIISSDGIFLEGQSLWYPSFGDNLLTFTLDVEIQEPWGAVSQGERTRHEQKGGTNHIRWESPEPQDEIYLIGGPFTEYTRSIGDVGATGRSPEIEAMVFLRGTNKKDEKDEKLAKSYLEATSQYLEMYSRLLGPYPYKKFALVENFWETGYGMPSFTLLGPTVIRLPFIIQSSYPHEILHNWWGNSVYVDYPSGNWSEGLTAYLADHLVQEQHGTGADYRRSILQKYADYVAVAKEFPLTEFRERHSAATEAVGYGKTMLFFHMLRQRLGDDTFIKGLREFYEKNRFHRANFDDIRKASEEASGEDLKAGFRQWVTRTGAPALRISQARAEPKGKGYLLTAVLEQVQPGQAYSLRVPIAIDLEGEEKAFQTTVQTDKKMFELKFDLSSRPLHLDIDPEFDLFRRVDRAEIPPALTQVFGAEEALILIPSGADKELREAYQKLAESLQRSQPWKLEVKLDSEMPSLPGDRSIWILGWENRFLKEVIAPLSPYQVSMNDSDIRIGNTELRRDRHSIALTARNPSNPDKALTLVATENPAALPGLSRKLVHYGKYSYLGFEGDEPANIAKGQWPVLASPMSIPVEQDDGFVVQPPRAQLASRRALADLPPAFSEERMLKEIRGMASEALRGRGLGTPELDWHGQSFQEINID
ncbi:MAG: peptidase M28, partial [Nitrospirae bacterium]|nr:peptidase M28 [Nitrospirota bacterium]